MASLGSVTPSTPGMVSRDYAGSYDEWIARAAMSMAERYARGDQTMIDSLSGATGSIGQPAGTDFNSTQGGAAAGQISYQTYDFFVSYVKSYGTSDPYLAAQYGSPPPRAATYIPDPDGAGALKDKDIAFASAEGDKDRALTASEGAADRANALAIAGIGAESARYGADKQFEAVSLQVANNWKIATMQDATDRYIAEGSWGVQKYVAELGEKGAMDRLKLELGMRDKELAQRAVEEKNRYDVSLKTLALEVAKYDADLAANPRNIMKYAAWLKSRDIIVSGLSVAMATQEVPESEIDPGVVAATFGTVAGITTAQEQMVSGASGGATSGQNAFGTNMVDMTGDNPMVNTAAPNAPPMQPAAPAPSSQQIGQMTPGDLAGSLLGTAGNGGTAAEYSTQNLQGMMDSLNTTGTRRQSSFGGWSGPTTNSLGVDIGPEVVGSNVDYRKFNRLLPSQQEMKIGGVASIRGDAGVNDWVSELERSRPKGGAKGSAAYG